MVGKPQPRHGLHRKRWETDPFESLLELADDRRALESESLGQYGERKRQVSTDPDSGAEDVQGEG